MIVHDVEQGSDEWLALRCGIPTASNFKKIITPKTVVLSASAAPYMNTLIAEWIEGGPIDTEISQWMERGKEMEEEGADWYAMHYDVDCTKVGFVTNDEGTIGGSPDRLVGDDGGLEVKVRTMAKHIGFMRNPPSVLSGVLPQVMGCMWLADRQWWDVLAYHPMYPVCVRVERDEAYIVKLSFAVEAFAEQLDDVRKEIIEMGMTPVPAGKVNDGNNYYGS